MSEEKQVNELALYREKPIAEIFKNGGAKGIVEEMKEKISSIVLDVTTPNGRKEIASIAHKVSKSKTYLDGQGKELKSEHKKICDQIDAERKIIRDELDALRDSVRYPLTEYENREKERVEYHESGLIILEQYAYYHEVNETGSSEIETAIDSAEREYQGRNWEEFSLRAQEKISSVKTRLHNILAKRKKEENERAELERLRKENEERERKEREDALKKEAADRARKEAEEKAHREKLEVEAKAKAEQERVEREKKEANDRAAKADADRLASEEKAKADAKAAKERAELEKQEAVEAERQRQADEKAKEDAERQKREADKKHRAKINNEAMYAIKKAGSILDADERAKAIVIAIIDGKIPHVKINY